MHFDIVDSYTSFFEKNGFRERKIIIENLQGFHGIAIVNSQIMLELAYNGFNTRVSNFLSFNLSRFLDREALFLISRINQIEFFLPKRDIIYVYHDAISYSQKSYIKRKLCFYLQDLLIKRSKHIVCISKTAQEEMVRYHPHAREKRTSIIYNKPQQINSTRYLLWIGNDFPHKRLNYIEKIAAKVKIKIYCVMSSPVDIHDKNITVFSNIPKELLGILIENSEGLLCVSSNEGFHLPVAEARSVGVPCYVITLPIFKELYHNDRGVHQFEDIAEMLKSLEARFD